MEREPPTHSLPLRLKEATQDPSQANEPPIHRSPGKARRIEARRIRRHLANLTLSDCHPQTQSPLFSALPPEIRNVIFQLAVSEYEDVGRSHDSNPLGLHPLGFYPLGFHPLGFHPGFRARFVVSTSLLLTCRRIYHETNGIPMRTATHRHWNRTQLKPPPEVCRGKVRYSDMTAKNQRELDHVQLFEGVDFLSWLVLRDLMEPAQFRPKRITVTVLCYFEPRRRLMWSLWGGWEIDWVYADVVFGRLRVPVECREFRLEVKVVDGTVEKGTLKTLCEKLRGFVLKRKDASEMAVREEDGKLGVCNVGEGKTGDMCSLLWTPRTKGGEAG